MDEGFQFLDIVLFAMVAAFIVHRLRSVLGRRTGHEQPPSSRGSQEVSQENVISLPDRSDDEREAEAEAAGVSRAALAGVAQVRIADPRFDAKRFLAGARGAYELIINAFAAGDSKALRPLLNDEVYENFEGAIRERQERDQSLDRTLVSIKSADIRAARMRGRDADITVAFVSEIVNVLRDAAGKVIEGDATAVREVTDVWTFRRNTRSSDPNWTLIETRAAE